MGLFMIILKLELFMQNCHVIVLKKKIMNMHTHIQVMLLMYNRIPLMQRFMQFLILVSNSFIGQKRMVQ